MAQNSYQEIVLTSNISLSWPFSFSGTNIVADINDVNPNQGGWKISLPNATLAAPGQTIIFNNISAFSFSITAVDTTTNIVTMAAGDVYEIYLRDDNTANGSWRVIPFGAGANNISAFVAESSDDTINITGGAVTPPGGVIDFKLPTSISNLNDVATVGFPIIKGFNPLTWKTVELVGGQNIVIENEDGIDGNPIISLNSDSISVGDITISGSTITSNITNGNIEISTNGTGKIYLNGVAIDINGDISGGGGGGLDNTLVPKAYCVFTDTLTDPTNTIVVENGTNVASVTGGGGTYVWNFTTAMPSINYGVIVTLGSTGGSFPFISNGYWTVRETTSITIVVTDASGVPVLSAPNGVTVLIMAT